MPRLVATAATSATASQAASSALLFEARVTRCPRHYSMRWANATVLLT